MIRPSCFVESNNRAGFNCTMKNHTGGQRDQGYKSLYSRKIELVRTRTDYMRYRACLYRKPSLEYILDPVDLDGAILD